MELEKTTAFVPISLRITSNQLGDKKDRDASVQLLIKEICVFIKSRHQCNLNGLFSGPETEPVSGIYEYQVGFVIWGSIVAVGAARGELLRLNVSQV